MFQIGAKIVFCIGPIGEHAFGCELSSGEGRRRTEFLFRLVRQIEVEPEERVIDEVPETDDVTLWPFGSPGGIAPNFVRARVDRFFEHLDRRPELYR